MSDQPETIRDEDEDTGTGRRAMDLELRTIAAILRLLDDMDDKAQTRTIRYLYARFGE